MRCHRSIVVALAAALVAAGPAWAGKDHKPPTEEQTRALEQARKELEQARQELSRAAKELAKASAEVGKFSPRAFAYEFIANPRRGMMGVIIDEGPTVGDEIRGLEIKAVTPGGGADKAGIKSGDVFVTVNGKSLVARKGATEHPWMLLKQATGEIEVGQKVEVEYERAGKKSAATIVAQRPEPLALATFPDIEIAEEDNDALFMPPAVPPVPGVPPLDPMRGPHGASGLHMATLDDDLGYYFKTRDGVLLVKVPKDSPLQLKSGDVLQKINGRRIADPRDALEALHAAGENQAVKLEVFRQGKVQTVEGRTPERTALAPERRKKTVVITTDD